jgi:hypothetical protein
MDLNHMARARLLLQSDLWVVGIHLDDRKELEQDRIVMLEDERGRIAGAINDVENRIKKLSAVD